MLTHPTAAAVAVAAATAEVATTAEAAVTGLTAPPNETSGVTNTDQPSINHCERPVLSVVAAK